MNDFNGSVAQQDVVITTEVVKTAVVGQNFYDRMLYVTDRFSNVGGDNPSYPVVTKDTYADVIDASAYFDEAEKKLIKENLSALFAYGTTLTVYIIPSSKVSDYKLYGYFTYLDLKWAPGTTETNADGDYAIDAAALDTLKAVKAYDKEFTFLLADMPVDPTKMRGNDSSSTAATLKQISDLTIDLALFARPARPAKPEDMGEAVRANAYFDDADEVIGPSPALYQLGRSLGKLNESGVPVGNAFDMDAVGFLNVLPTADTDLEVLMGAGTLMANWFDGVKVNYFKPVGNGTMDITNMGGWTLLKNCIGAEWVVAYLNFMNRVACATIITRGGRTLKSPRTYESILSAVVANCSDQMKNGRITEFQLTAPSFGALPKTDGHTIKIPNAWVGVYVDNVRKVQISGTLTVAM